MSVISRPVVGVDRERLFPDVDLTFCAHCGVARERYPIPCPNCRMVATMALPDVDLTKTSPAYRKFIEDCVTAWMHKRKPTLEVEYITVMDPITRQKRVVARVSNGKSSMDFLQPSLEAFVEIMRGPPTRLLG